MTFDPISFGIGAVIGLALVFVMVNARDWGYALRQRVLAWAQRELEIDAALDLQWRVFAQKHNAGGGRPRCEHSEWEAQLNEVDKAAVYEFPDGDAAAPPNVVVDALQREHDREKGRVKRELRQLAGLPEEPS